jgi:hypothetical protein
MKGHHGRKLGIISILGSGMAMFAASVAFAGPSLSSNSDSNPVVTTGPAPVSNAEADAVLADGTVTHEEMEAALIRMVGCINDAGFQSRLETFVPRLRIEISVSKGPAGNDQAAMDAAYASCEAKHVSLVSVAYAEEHRLTAAEVAERNAARVDCMSRLSTVPAQGRSLEVMKQLVDPWVTHQCDREVPVPLQ